MYWLFDGLHSLTYALMLKTPNRRAADQMAPLLVSAIVMFHLIGLLVLISYLSATNLFAILGKEGLLAIIVLGIGFVVSYFYLSEQGKLIRSRQNCEYVSSRKAWMGAGLMLWTVCFPFICGGVAIILQGGP